MTELPHAPAAARNLDPILTVLKRHAPASGRALELASGTGQHAVAFAAAHPGLDWQPTEADPARLPAIAAWAAAYPQPNLSPARLLDAGRPGWGVVETGQALIVAVNLLQIVPEPVAEVILNEAPRALAPGGVLMFYGPFLRAGLPTSPGDATFDAELRTRGLGLKDCDKVVEALAAAGLRVEVEAMPANNLMLIARRAGLAETPAPVPIAG